MRTIKETRPFSYAGGSLFLLLPDGELEIKVPKLSQEQTAGLDSKLKRVREEQSFSEVSRRRRRRGWRQNKKVLIREKVGFLLHLFFCKMCLFS